MDKRLRATYLYGLSGQIMIFSWMIKGSFGSVWYHPAETTNHQRVFTDLVYRSWDN